MVRGETNAVPMLGSRRKVTDVLKCCDQIRFARQNEKASM
jgi:hypothetical protein